MNLKYTEFILNFSREFQFPHIKINWEAFQNVQLDFQDLKGVENCDLFWSLQMIL